MLDRADLAAVWITLKLAFISTALLMVIGTPVAWWLVRTRCRLRFVYVSQNAAEIAALCDRIALMEAGPVCALPTREEFIARRKPDLP